MTPNCARRENPQQRGVLNMPPAPLNGGGSEETCNFGEKARVAPIHYNMSRRR